MESEAIREEIQNLDVELKDVQGYLSSFSLVPIFVFVLRIHVSFSQVASSIYIT